MKQQQVACYVRRKRWRPKSAPRRDATPAWRRRLAEVRAAGEPLQLSPADLSPRIEIADPLLTVVDEGGA